MPYLSAGELMNIYFDSKNIPTPNRMNWKDRETDEWLRLGRAALTDADRAKHYMLVQKKVTDEHLWIPVINVDMYTGQQQEAERACGRTCSIRTPSTRDWITPSDGHASRGSRPQDPLRD